MYTPVHTTIQCIAAHASITTKERRRTEKNKTKCENGYKIGKMELRRKEAVTVAMAVAVAATATAAKRTKQVKTFKADIVRRILGSYHVFAVTKVIHRHKMHEHEN